MTAITSVGCGLAIRTLALLPAVQAWPKLEAPLHFPKLAALRARTGNVVSGPVAGRKSAMGKVLVEE
ncbi:hypothetical protein JCM3770_001693 [Rhodotorula araucariae]